MWKQLEELLGRENRDLLIGFEGAYIALDCVYQEVAYRQGLADGMALQEEIEQLKSMSSKQVSPITSAIAAR